MIHDQNIKPAKVLISAEDIRARVQALAEQISRDYAGKDLVIVAVLKGSVIFFADLVRLLTINCSVDFVAASSYRGRTSTGTVQLLTDLRSDPAGKDLLLVEDIVDTGYTLDFLRKHLLTRSPASVRVCALLNKPAARKIPVEVAYAGFTLPDTFVVGYGLDYDEQYRGLPYIGELSPEYAASADSSKSRRPCS